MSDAVGTEPELRLDSPEQDRAAEPTSMAEWCERHGVIGALLPFDCRATDSFEQFCAIAAAIDDLRPTIATFRLTDLEPPGDAFARIEQRPTGAGVVPTQLHMLGAWEYRDTAAGQRWTNPRYCHDHPWQTPQCSDAERREILRDAASLGVLDRRDVAPRFGITAGSLRQWISRKDVAWEARRYQGRQRLARTVYTIYKWTDRTEQGVIAPFPVPDGTLKAWIQKFVREDETWSVPADPSNGRHFRGDRRHDR